MKIFIAGATGAVGKRLVPLLVARGHDVVGMTRSPGKVAALTAAGARAVVAEALDRDAVTAALAAARPDVVVHQLTSLGRMGSLRRFDDQFALTNRLRTEGMAILIDAARQSGAGRIVAQSFAGWPYAREGGPIKVESDPFDPDPPRAMRRTLDAIRELERRVAESGMTGLALRYGGFYGPGTSLGKGGEIAAMVRRRRFPIVGSGAGVWSFLHIDDAASATAAAIERGAAGVYNVVDDDPAPVETWLPALAAALGAPPPRRVPALLGHLFVGAAGVSLMTRIRGAANGKARRELDWTPRYPSWREGFRTGLG
jgi:2-alkyl-3-oxoalkanoate reductase